MSFLSIELNIIEYDILVEESLYELIVEVNKKIKEGWKLYGDNLIDVDNNGKDYYYQTMVKLGTDGLKKAIAGEE